MGRVAAADPGGPGFSRAPVAELAVIHVFRLNFFVSEVQKPRPSMPPYNPGLRELVAGKQHWSRSLRPEDARRGFRGWHERGYVPHRDEPGLVQFVTFRLSDSFP